MPVGRTATLSAAALELVEHNINVFKQNTLEKENISIKQGNALDLSFLPDNHYDVTLLLGPLYHLYSTEDKRKAISEAIRVTKAGGIIFAAYVISDGCLIDEGFNRGNISVAEYIKNGLLDEKTFEAKSEPKDLFELVRKEDIDELMSVFPVTRLHYVATDGCSLLLREAIDNMDDETFKDMLEGFGVGCDDYIPKPFSIEVLRKKVQAVLKRTGGGKSRIRYRDLEVDTDKCLVMLNGEEVRLTSTEYKLLCYLIENKGRIVTKAMLLEQLWDIDGNFVDENTVRVNIKRLRQKLNDDKQEYIVTVFGMGYTFGE